MARAHYPRGDRSATDLAAMLAERAEDVCRTYLRGGSRNGRRWRVGSVADEPGQSLWVSLRGNDRGRWKDEAVPEHNGDMLDLIRAVKGIGLTDAMDEAALFLGLPPPEQAAKAVAAGGPFGAVLRDALILRAGATGPGRRRSGALRRPAAPCCPIRTTRCR